MSKGARNRKNPNLMAKEREQKQREREQRVTRWMIILLLLVAFAFAGFLGYSGYRIWQIHQIESKLTEGTIAEGSYAGDGDFTKVIQVDADMLLNNGEVDPVAYFGPSQEDTYRFRFLNKEGKDTGAKDIVKIEMTETFYQEFILELSLQMEKEIRDSIDSDVASHILDVEASAADNFENVTIKVRSEDYDPSQDIFPAMLGAAITSFQSYTEQGVTGCVITIVDENGDFIATVEPH